MKYQMKAFSDISEANLQLQIQAFFDSVQGDFYIISEKFLFNPITNNFEYLVIYKTNQ